MADVTPAHVDQLSADGRWRWDGARWQPVAPAVPRLPAWAEGRVRQNATWAALAAAVLVGLLADQSLRNGRFGLAASLTIVLGGAASIWVGGLRRLESRLLVLVAAVFAVCLTLRASPWLLWPDLIVALSSSGSRPHWLCAVP